MVKLFSPLSRWRPIQEFSDNFWLENIVTSMRLTYSVVSFESTIQMNLSMISLIVSVILFAYDLDTHTRRFHFFLVWLKNHVDSLQLLILFNYFRVFALLTYFKERNLSNNLHKMSLCFFNPSN